VNRQLGRLDGHQDDDLEQVAGAVRADDQPTVWIFAGVFDRECMVNSVLDVLVGDTVLARRLVNLHPRLAYYETPLPPRVARGSLRIYLSRQAGGIDDEAGARAAGASDTCLNASQARDVVDATFGAITAELVAGGDVAIAGFGKFTASERSAREGRNPATGDPIQIKASDAARFSAATALKTALNA